VALNSNGNNSAGRAGVADVKNKRGVIDVMVAADNGMDEKER